MDKRKNSEKRSGAGRKRAIAFLLSLTLCVCGIPPFGLVEEAYGGEIADAVTLEFFLDGAPIGTVTASIDDIDGRLIGPVPEAIFVPAGTTTGTITVTDLYSSSITSTAFTLDGSTTKELSYTAGMKCVANIQYEYVNTTSPSAVASGNGTLSVSVKEERPQPKSPWTVSVNGADCPITPGVDTTYTGNATVNSPDISVMIQKDSGGGGITYGLYKESTELTSWTGITLSNYTLPGVGEYEIQSYSDNLRFYITYTIPPSSGGSSSRPSEPPPDVVNEENAANQSSDTILTPNGTQEDGGKSTTNVTSREVDALMELAEEHKDDIPEGEREAIIHIEDGEGSENTEYEVAVPGADFNRLANSAADVIVVNTAIGDFRIRSSEGKNLGKTGDVEIRLRKIDHNGKPGLDARLLDDGEDITKLEGLYVVEIRIPYEPAEGEDLSALIIEYIREDGTVEIVTESRYDPVDKCIVFFVQHLSKYGVAYRPKLFKDVKSTHWASGAITFLAARKVISGSGDGRFRPDDKISKVEFLSMMTTAFSAASLGKKAVKSYKDVPLNAWYAKAVGWSYLNNISNPIAKNGMLYPLQALSREDMATLSNNISLSLGLRLKIKKPAVSFKDQKSIAAYAVPGVTRMSQCGIVSGNQSGKFMPKSGLTRAEAASIISTLMAGMR